MVSLDAVGNTTKAVTKGFAIGSAVIAAVALFASYGETILEQIAAPGCDRAGRRPTRSTWPTPRCSSACWSVAPSPSSSPPSPSGPSPAPPAWWSQEVRRQFADGKIMNGEKEPDYGPAIDICTTASLRELATPALIAVLAPVIIGFGLGPISPGCLPGLVIVVGQLMANFLSNAGGAWDNAKKYIEDGAEGGKGSEPHKAAVIGDTVGDPFKDTAGPALNPLIKVMNLVSLLILPAIIGFYDKAEPGRAASSRPSPPPSSSRVVAAIVVVAAIAYSKGVFSNRPSGIAAD